MATAKKTAEVQEGIVEYNGKTFDLNKLNSYREYQKEYSKKKYKSFAVRFHTEKDKDLVTFLDKRNEYVPDITKYFRALIRADLKRRNIKPKVKAKK